MNYIPAWIDTSHLQSVGTMATTTTIPWQETPPMIEEDDIFDDPDFEDEDTEFDSIIPWHGVLCPEGVPSGDGRMFSADAITWRDLPLPFRWQRLDVDQHDGSTVVGSIDRIWRDNGMIFAEGVFLDVDSVDELVGLIADGAVRGVSVDVDAAELSADPEGEDVEFSRGRVSAATIVAIPAFPEAYVALGPYPGTITAAISEKPWDGSASRFTPEEYKRSCVLHRSDGMSKDEHSLPIREPNGDLNRAAVHAAAARINQVKDATPAQVASAKRALRGAYKQLGEEPPESLQASVYARGPGWVTNPKETRRLHAYWTQPGHKGYAKVRWGTPGDFRRLRKFLAKYISPQYLNRVAAQWHHDATGHWPGECGYPGNPPCGKSRRHHASIDDLVQLDHASERDQNTLSEGSSVHAGEHLHHSDDGKSQMSGMSSAGVQARGPQDGARTDVGTGGHQRSRSMLDLARREDDASGVVAGGSSVRRDLGRAERVGKDPSRASGGMGIHERPYPAGHDNRSSVQSETLRQSSTSGGCDCGGEHASAMAPSVAMTASIALGAPAAWFADPGFSAYQPFVVEDDRVYGHLAVWRNPDGTPACHIGSTGLCRTPPRSEHAYAYFRTGSVRTEEGLVPTGVITMDTDHPDPYDDPFAAKRHYADTGLAVADVAVGDDEIGIWVAGMIRPGTSDERKHALQASALSGDWRPVGGAMELVAALAVNHPGFPIPRPILAAVNGEQTALIVYAPEPVEPPATKDVVASIVSTMNVARVDRVRSIFGGVS